MKKTCLGLLIVVLITASLVLGGAGNLAKAQSGVNTSTVISADTTWTQANSPYDITGNVLVNSGATLTLSAGTTLNLNGYMVVAGSLTVQPGVTINIVNASGYIQVNGVLSAIGTTAQPIQISGSEGQSQMLFGGPYYPQLTFSQSSTGWNEQTSSGCIIEDAAITLVQVSISSSVKLTGDTLTDAASLSIMQGSPTITGNVIETGIGINGGTPIISFNTIKGSITCSAEPYDGPGQPTAYIDDNTFSGGTAAEPGIMMMGNSLGCTLVIERNTINTDNYTGIDIGMADNGEIPALIINNTIVGNNIGIDLYWGYPQLISGNNIYNNQVNVKLDENDPINCSNNWWGTTDQTAIGNSIYDFKNDFRLGTVTFTPFLTAPNPEASPNQNLPIPTATVTPSPKPYYLPANSTMNPFPDLHTGQPSQTANLPTPASSQNQPAGAFSLSTIGVTVLVAVLLAVIAGLSVAVAVLLRRKNTN
ncbi:MAG: hypothetical protein ABSG33_06015 [Candidatus Bathyarchaeia archaeon]